MIRLEALAAVWGLASTVEDVDAYELEALEVVARELDQQINRQTNANPLVDFDTPAEICPHPANEPGKTCTLCQVNGMAHRPRIGWSNRVAALDLPAPVTRRPDIPQPSFDFPTAS